jgi:post-segregation antitoxin (ccd killing protein)
MAQSYGKQTEKVTFNISVELKERLLALKNELHVSLSSLYNEAIARYLREKELEKWEKGVSMALKDSEYKALNKELGADGGSLHEY